MELIANYIYAMEHVATRVRVRVGGGVAGWGGYDGEDEEGCARGGGERCC